MPIGRGSLRLSHSDFGAALAAEDSVCDDQQPSRSYGSPSRSPLQRADRLLRFGRGPDLIADLCDSNSAHFIEDRYDVTMHGHHLGADRHFYVRVRLVQLEKLGQDLVVRNKLAIERDNVSGMYLDGHVIFLLLRRRRDSCREIYFNAFHVGLAKAHHHEARQQKEHDVDQWDDLNARAFLGNRRSDMHKGASRMLRSL